MTASEMMLSHQPPYWILVAILKKLKCIISQIKSTDSIKLFILFNLTYSTPNHNPNPKPQTINFKPQTTNPEQQALNFKP
jgi:hypothetical protein